MNAPTDEIPVHNPAASEAWIREVSNRIAKGVAVVTSAEREAKRKRREFDLAYAHAYKRAEGSIKEREYAADIAAMPHREAAENAELAYKHAERTAKALEKELMAAMAVNSNIRSMWTAAGVS